LSTNIPTEVRRISDARSRLKSIIDQQARAQAALLSPDNFKFQVNATLAQSDLGLTDDITIDAQGSAAVSGLVPPQAPIEPDLATLMMWMPFSNLGNQDDLAMMGNTGHTRGACTLVTGPTGNGNQLIGGVRAIDFDGSTSYVDVADNAEIRIGSGFSFCLRINTQSFSTQIDDTAVNYDSVAGTSATQNTIAAKADDANNAWRLFVDTAGNLRFQVKKAGTSYMRRSNALSLSTWYDIAAVFTGTGVLLYVNNVETGISAALAYGYPSATDNDLHIGRFNNVTIPGNEYGLGAAYDYLGFDRGSFDAGDYLDILPGTAPFDPICFDPVCYDTDAGAPGVPHSTIHGGYNGLMYDPRLYNIVLTAAQVGYLYANKFSVSNISLGQSANAGYCLSHS